MSLFFCLERWFPRPNLHRFPRVGICAKHEEQTGSILGVEQLVALLNVADWRQQLSLRASMEQPDRSGWDHRWAIPRDFQGSESEAKII